VEYEFDAKKTADSLVENTRAFLKDALREPKVVLGISGGKDSAIAATICARAIGAENVLGVMMPNGQQRDISDSINVCESLGIRHTTVNIGPAYEALTGSIFDCDDDSIVSDRESLVNVGPRLRMTTLRYIAQQQGALLCGTGNLSESFVGYCTKDGDTSCDFNPLGSLTSIEVVKVGECFEECPSQVVHKTPDDGLSGMSDEEKMGITYQMIHDHIRFGSCGDERGDKEIDRRHKASAHKRRMPHVITA